eukprot:gene24944-biopygen20938
MAIRCRASYTELKPLKEDGATRARSKTTDGGRRAVACTGARACWPGDLVGQRKKRQRVCPERGHSFAPSEYVRGTGRARGGSAVGVGGSLVGATATRGWGGGGSILILPGGSARCKGRCSYMVPITPLA